MYLPLHRHLTAALMIMFKTLRPPLTSPMLLTSILTQIYQATLSRRHLLLHLDVSFSIYHLLDVASPPLGQSILMQTLQAPAISTSPPNPPPMPPQIQVEVETPAFKPPPVVNLSEENTMEQPVAKAKYEEMSKEETKQNLNLVFSKLPPPPPPRK